MTEENKKLYEAIETLLAHGLTENGQPDELTAEQLRDYLDGKLDKESLELLLRDKQAVRLLLELNEPPTIYKDDPDEPMSDEELSFSLSQITDGMIQAPEWVQGSERSWRKGDSAKALSTEMDMVESPQWYSKTRQKLVTFWKNWRGNLMWLAACGVIALVGIFRSSQSNKAFVIDDVQTLRFPSETLRANGETLLTNASAVLDIRLPNLHRDYAQYSMVIRDGERVLKRFRVDGPRRGLPLHLPAHFFDKPGIYRLDISAIKDGEIISIGGFDLSVEGK